MDALLELWSREDPFWSPHDLQHLRHGSFARRTQPPTFSAAQLVAASKRLVTSWFEVRLPTVADAAALEEEIGSRACTERPGGGRVLRIYAPDKGLDR